MIESLPEGAASVLQAVAAVCGATTVLLVFSVVVWTARDIASRTRDAFVRVCAVVLVLALPGVGLIAYLLLRPRETLAERYERELIEEILARELTAGSVDLRRTTATARPPTSPGHRAD